jgi:hypothetical protein
MRVVLAESRFLVEPAARTVQRLNRAVIVSGFIIGDNGFEFNAQFFRQHLPPVFSWMISGGTNKGRVADMSAANSAAPTVDYDWK